jgi:crotonobetainyl-CoA:carnitine CoA-transferase CaiB-like acyl-CoA transferase
MPASSEVGTVLKHAFEGIRVVELGGYIVGALCAELVGELGAEVIKFESQQGDGLRPQLGSFQGWNRGKRGIVVDLRTDEGRRILHQLVEMADVLVQNLRPGVAERWGADYETLSRLNPRLVYLAMPGYGPTGPYADKPGFDPLLQAMSGTMAAQGGDGNPPVFHRVPLSDNAGAMLGAYGVALALFQRARTGKGQYLQGSLLNSAIAVQSGEFIGYEGKSEEPRMGYWGVDALCRMYETEDEPIFISCRSDEPWEALCRAVGRDDLSRDPRFNTTPSRGENATELAALLEAVFTGGPAQKWLDALEAAGVPCAPVNLSRALFEHPHVLENDFVVEHESADLGKLRQRGIVVKMSETPGISRRAAPGLGQHTDEVLQELAYSEEQIADLRQRRIVM